ncbi:unnamed protein product [Closterium sp. Yama58-4]|nr:unnamed protein product [Closterium sp. Yama58-4]
MRCLSNQFLPVVTPCLRCFGSYARISTFPQVAAAPAVLRISAASAVLRLSVSASASASAFTRSRTLAWRSANPLSAQIAAPVTAFAKPSRKSTSVIAMASESAAAAAEAVKTMEISDTEKGQEGSPLVTTCNNPKFGDYQCNNAMGIWSRIKGSTTDFKNPNAIGQAIAKNLPPSPMVEKTSIAGPGFVNIVLTQAWLEDHVSGVLKGAGIAAWAPRLPVKRAVVDFSSPNIAKEMHVGHLRSTIIGDTLARMLEYCHVEVLRRNHVGDWGTQFGMLIEYLFDKFPDWETIGDQAIGDLQVFYKAAKKRFDEDAEFKERAQRAVVKLQGGEEEYRKAWAKICDVSRKEFDLVYQRLGIKLEEKGESFYNSRIPAALEKLKAAGLVVESEGAQCIFVEGHKVPLIVVKSDGGFNYATTDLTCLLYRIEEEKAEWVVYVTDVGQSQHFDMFFKAAQKAGFYAGKAKKGKAAAASEEGSTAPAIRVDHVGFGLVLGEDGKRFRTRSSEVVRLVDLLDEAVTRAKQGLVERGREGEWKEEEVNAAAAALGYGAVKYADLKNNRLTNYTFDYDQMLDMKGNTAVYLLYAHARICSIIRKSGKNVEEIVQSGTKLRLDHPSERALALELSRFSEVVESAVQDLLPNTLCEYLYNLSGSFTTFYTNCQVVGNEYEDSRLIFFAKRTRGKIARRKLAREEGEGGMGEVAGTGAAGRLRVRALTEEEVDVEGESIADDYYSILGLTCDATPEEIKRAYYACMKACHPDLSNNHPDSVAFCSFVNEVYEVLSDPEMRLVYDEIKGYSLTSINPFMDTRHEKDQVFVDEFTCIGCKNCANTAEETFEIEEMWGRARVCNQGGNPPAKIQEAVETCPVSCIHWVTAPQLALLEDEMRRMERVSVAIMQAQSSRGADVFMQANSRWEKRRTRALSKAKAQAARDGKAGKYNKPLWETMGEAMGMGGERSSWRGDTDDVYDKAASGGNPINQEKLSQFGSHNGS